MRINVVSVAALRRAASASCAFLALNIAAAAQADNAAADAQEPGKSAAIGASVTRVTRYVDSGGVVQAFDHAQGRDARTRAFARASEDMNSLSTETLTPNIAFYYGHAVPVPELSAFDAVVVEPDSDFDPKINDTPHTAWFAYTSLGEVHSTRPYFKDIPKAWLIGENKAWDSAIIDLSVPQWRTFFVDRVIAPLWERGYRNFFFDTIDSYRAQVKSAAEQARQEAGAVAVIRAVKERYPSARLILNRGFELLPEVHSLVYAVAFESLFQGWDQAKKRYLEVPPQDREWLMVQVRKAKELGLPVVAIDYCPPTDVDCARNTAAKIRELGVVPYVTTPLLDRVGVGAVRVEPRRILVLRDTEAGADLAASDAVRYLGVPIHYLGYRADYIDGRQALPQEPLNDRYAGVVLWMNRDYPRPRELRSWIIRQIDAGMPIAVMGGFGLPIDQLLAGKLGLRAARGTPQGTLTVESSDSKLLGFEMAPQPNPRDYVAIRTERSGQSLLTLKAGSFQIDAAAITRWGGYVMRPFAVTDIAEIGQTRWVIHPLLFLQQALRLPKIPVPDTTTEAGRRLFMTQIEGVGLGEPTELEGARQNAVAGAVLADIVQKHGWPTTVSLAESDLIDKPYHKESPLLRSVAQRMFALPNVEIAAGISDEGQARWLNASWPAAAGGKNAQAGNDGAREGLQVAAQSYRFDTERDTAAAIGRLADTLAPAGKPVKMVFWRGASPAPGQVIKAAYNANLVTMSGGDTVITKRYPSWTAISPPAVFKDGYLQISEPNQSELRYTNYWQGPFYGFERVLETFELTDRPIRIRPVDVHIHMFTGSRLASVTALERVYGALSGQSLHPVFTSEYARKVIDFYQLSIAREGDTWIVRDAGQLRTVRLQSGDAPDLSTSVGVAGYVAGPGGVYVHLTGTEARFNVLTGTAVAANSSLPYLADANGRIEQFIRNAQGISFDLRSHGAPEFRLANTRDCRVMADGRIVTPDHSSAYVPVTSPAAPKRHESMTHVDVDCES
ncbi:MAG TPA: endo alpha-1,4 polygalactosaminidase [Trinickia sp.]|uniref:endo alpha-1,4 polygalactosaminidase n=1 Tax=Trinickia sp. TaxID=2571163 RepID=UPI002B9AB1D5|nr:endo alpha-1,4 polygalactosaminidase [Trinickia sp.]HTI17301.1 endo alpha-1,4 polygalactosaminidase [Trinickia sp.]